MALVSPQVPNITGSAVTMSTPTTSETFVPGTNVYYYLQTGGTGTTATIVVPGSVYGQARPDVANVLGTSTDRLMGPLLSDLADPTTGLVTITLSSIASCTAAALILGG